MDADRLRALFTKPYGAPPPSQEQWRQAYADNVHFQDPTQERHGIAAYLEAQEGLLKRCDDVYPGTTRLLFNDEGRIVDHRDYFDFVGPTFAPVPLVGGFVRWLYRRFVA